MIRLRPPSVGDLKQIVALDQEIFGPYGADEDADIIRARLEVFPQGCVLVEEMRDREDPRVAGYLTTEKWHTAREPALNEDPHTTHDPAGRVLNITTLAVAPSHQGRGLGQRLVEEAIGIAEKEACDLIVLETARAAEFYEKLGFTRSGEREERGIRLFILQLSISPRSIEE